MKKYIFLFFFCSFSLFSSEIISIKADRSFVLDESKFILPHHFRMYADPYHENIFMQVPYGYVVYDNEGNLLKKCLYEGSQEPGGLTTALQINFFKNFYYVADHFKANKYNYNHKFLKLLHVGLGIGMFSCFTESGTVCFHSFNDGFVKSDVKDKVIIKNKQLLILPKTYNSMAMFFVYPNIYYDKYKKLYYAIFKHEYKIYEIEKNNLKVLKTFGDIPTNYKRADDTKPNVCKRTSIEDYIKIVKGYSSSESIFSNKKYLFVYWCNRYTADSFIDVYDKKTNGKVKTLNLEALKGKNGLVVAYDDINLKFYQEDIVPNDNDDDEKTVIREYDLKRYIDE